METGTLSVFKHEGWLGKGKDWSKKSVDIPAIERGKRVIDSEFCRFMSSVHYIPADLGLLWFRLCAM